MRRIDITTIETDKKILQFDISTNGRWHWIVEYCV